mmetsp:Transcript_5754/g.6982  ORF Transcript_5754/g.6982 Transcript_5754/m.6982 type:complete len:953 (-) Transcript_5754:92-2950(-)
MINTVRENQSRANFLLLLSILVCAPSGASLASGSYEDRFYQERFNARLSEALKKVRTTLDTERDFAAIGSVAHKYDDKYLMAEYVTNTALQASTNILHRLGFSQAQLEALRAKSIKENRSIVLEIHKEDTCTFLRSREVETDAPTKVVHESGIFGSYTKEKRVSQKFTEYVWEHATAAALSLRLTGEESKVFSQLNGRYSTEIARRSKTTPLRELDVARIPELDVTWLVRNLQQIKIDRSAKDCLTPRRNKQIQDAVRQFVELGNWADRVSHELDNGVWKSYLAAESLPDIFQPVSPIFDVKEGKVISTTDADILLKQHEESLEHFVADVGRQLPAAAEQQKPSPDLLSVMPLMKHWAQTLENHLDSVNYIEHLLKEQLNKAIGRTLSAKDFRDYMMFHNQKKLFKSEYQPRPFTFAVRREAQYSPEGTVAIHYPEDNELIHTSVRVRAPSPAASNMSFPLSASTSVKFHGKHFIHSFLNHQLGYETTTRLELAARARQFSGFIVVLGKIKSATELDPKQAIIVQNKDDLRIPLVLEQIPSPKAFRDFISSLSPEQQRFAQAYRNMQLEGTLFGMVVIQIKPALEKVLNLPPGSLTKEIQLTEDLMTLFIKYQIPTDLISYRGDEVDLGASPLPSNTKDEGARAASSSSMHTRVEQVRQQANTMMRMLESKKTKLVEESQKAAEYAKNQKEAMMRRKLKKDSSHAERATYSTASVTDSKRFVPRMAAMSINTPTIHSSIPPEEVDQASGAGGDASPQAEMGEQSDSKDGREPEAEVTTFEDRPVGGEGDVATSAAAMEDYTRIAIDLDRALEKLDVDGAARPTKITVEKNGWVKRYRESLLSRSENIKTLLQDDVKRETDRAFDLLDALSRSGGLVLEGAELHVVVAATHAFDKTLVDTVAVDNVNPIEKVERTALIMAAQTHKIKEISSMIDQQFLKRVESTCPVLFEKKN